MLRSDTLPRALIAVLFTYLVTVGATFNGVLLPEFRQLTLVIIALVAVAWGSVRRRRGWCWHHSALDGAMVLWVVAIGVSLLVNHEVWRRQVIGVWYVGAYIVVWYGLHDALANGGIRRDMLVDGLLFSGLVVLIFGYVQVGVWLRGQMDVWRVIGLEALELPRVVSLIGNPNALGGFLVVLIPVVLARFAAVKLRPVRILLAGYGLLALFLLFLTFSRGAWAGAAAALGAWVALMLSAHDLLSARRLGRWWSAQSAGLRSAVLGVNTLIAAAIIGMGVLVVRSFAVSGRTIGMRAGIYGAALDLWAERPLFGAGLFTFGRGLARMQSMPPETPHSHAHNIPLNIGAELGLVGLLALAATLVFVVRAGRRNWRQGTQRDRMMLAGAGAALAGFGVHQLLDIPAMMPAIALAGLVALVLLAAPGVPVRVNHERNRAQNVLAGGLVVALLGTGLWSNAVYGDYVAAVRYGIDSEDFAGAAERLQPVINRDPSLALYYLQQGFLYGLAAHAGDIGAARNALAAYDRFIALEPSYAVAWANRAGLLWQVGDRDGAVASMEAAVARAPESWQLALILGRYAEQSGDVERARRAYSQALSTFGDLQLLPESRGATCCAPTTWEFSGRAETLLRLLDEGDAAGARQVWRSHPNSRLNNSARYVVDALLAAAEGDRAAAVRALERAGALSRGGLDEAWWRAGRAWLAREDGDRALADDELATARAALERALFESDYRTGENLGQLQFLRMTIARQFLPQLDYPVTDPALLYLLERLS